MKSSSSGGGKNFGGKQFGAKGSAVSPATGDMGGSPLPPDRLAMGGGVPPAQKKGKGKGKKGKAKGKPAFLNGK